MQPALEKLRKFFRLEHQNGYADTAIIGGLAKMLDYWEGEARAEGIEEEIVQAVVQRLQSYAHLAPESRAESLQGLWKRIQESYPESDAPPSKRPVSERKPNQQKEKKPERVPAKPTPRGRAETAPGGKTSATPAALEADLTVLQGVGPRHAQTLGKLGLHVLDILGGGW